MINWENEKENLKQRYVDKLMRVEDIGSFYGVSGETIRLKINKFKIKRENDILIIRRDNNGNAILSHSDVELICQNCNKKFIVDYRDRNRRKYCSEKCFHQSKKIILEKETLLKQLEENDWNYTITGELNRVSDNTIKKNLIGLGLHKSKQKDWSDVVDLKSAQKKIDELRIKTASELRDNFSGLSDRLDKMKLTSQLIYSGTEFDSSWEENIFNLIKDNVTYTNLSHNIILDPECKYERPLIFDIVIEHPNNSKTVIEIQGPTHFREIYTKERFEITRKRDEIKYNYCKDNNISLLYFTYDFSLIKTYGYPHYVYTDENLLLEKIKELSC